ncbi:transcriptional regulator [Acidovorax sp. CF316]|nr:transcriptional regulator [Acidovorax sp. CF316]
MHDKDRLLRTFLLAAQGGSLQKAADKLGLTQPAVSKQISALESFLECALFTRHGRGMALTPPGQRLAQSVAEQFALLDAALDTVRSAADAVRYVRIASVNTLAAYLLPPVVAALRQAHPALVVRLDTASSPDVVDQVVRGHADLGMVYDLAVNTDAVQVQRLYHEEMCAYGLLPPGAQAVPLTVAALAQRPLIVPPRPYALRRVIERELPGPLAIAAECSSVSASLDLAAAGVGMVILPGALPELAVAPRGLARFAIADADLGRQVVVIHRAGPQPPQALAAALQVIGQFAARAAWRAQ